MDKRTKAGLTRQIERNLISSWERKKAGDVKAERRHSWLVELLTRLLRQQ